MSTSTTTSTSLLQNLLYLAYSWLVIVPVLLISTAILCGSMILVSMLGMPDIASSVFGKAWSRVNLAVMLAGVDIEGVDKINRNQSYVVTANHQSLIDIYVLNGYLSLDFKWVMKQELKKVPILGMACVKMGHIIIDRSNTKAAQESINKARTSIERGNSVVFFPEGTRSLDGQLLPFKKGAFRLATELKLPVLPITIQGTKDILPASTKNWHPGRIKMRILDPITAEEVAGMDANALTARTKAVIEAGMKHT